MGNTDITGTLPVVQCMLTKNVVEVSDEIVIESEISLDNRIILKIDNIENDADIYISFPWGNNMYDLATYDYANKILCSVGYGFEVSEVLASDKHRERYWVVRRCEDMKDNENPYTYIMFSNIYPYKAGTTYMSVNYCRNNDKGPETRLAITKKALDLRIECFEPIRGSFHKNDNNSKVILSWCVFGAYDCVINPGNIPVPYIGTKEISVQDTCTYTLRASNGIDVVTKEIILYEYDESIMEYFEAVPDLYYYGSKTRLSWKTALKEGTNISIKADSYDGQNDKPDLQTLWNSSLSKGDLEDSIGDKEYSFEFQRDGDSYKSKLIIELKPDKDKAILRFDVNPITDVDEDNLYAFNINWEVDRSAKSVEMFVRYKDDENTLQVNGYSQYMISNEKFADSTTWGTNDFKNVTLVFILRVKNKDGEIREVVKCFHNINKVSEFSNL